MRKVFVKKTTDLFKVMQLVSGTACIETQVCLIPKLIVFFFYNVLDGLVLTWFLVSQPFRTRKTLGIANSSDFVTIILWAKEFFKRASEAARSRKMGKSLEGKKGREEISEMEVK